MFSLLVIFVMITETKSGIYCQQYLVFFLSLLFIFIFFDIISEINRHETILIYNINYEK